MHHPGTVKEDSYTDTLDKTVDDPPTTPETSATSTPTAAGKVGRGRARAQGPGASAQAQAALPTEVEETLKRIQSHKGVIGTMVVNAEGIPIRTTLDNSSTVQYAGLLHQLTMKAKSTVRDIDPQNDLTFLRIRSKKHEIMVAPDKEYLLIVIQNPCE
ncbi:PREDICTED: dynein light chain roadblock-type 2 [Elephantulus edwardii]|uniref:dynein light chain roadblock-type 2 n=1 Tax=Elephantulus edwardii TaxID=28737 RepID=UPI0003F05E4F|nr:PREDICTED: dynein light chain roadblock-type 2 [Elephantulus edwardii]